MQIQQLVYQSLATVAITPAQLQHLLPTWRTRNHATGLSGLLLYGEQGVIQVLEGSPASVHQIYQRILRDARHYNVHTLADGLVPARAFGQWSMGFVELGAPDLSRLAGYVSPAQPAGLVPSHPQAWPELTALLQEFGAREQSSLITS
ncbi:hypothetical protein GO988_01680 [Hymenobacter sp. HMF4947]|uniref:BLUF domain-containing protein n=1 Tax=Hymenobacter ginkgonis TaxID=2682976 RepID=A0A7K1T9E7_9BACT|nr:BLUF domain-containing protein [Hymenobacter ginkgonis]MVN75029.1 hypothetical protein [Hymenobacter ginkgonis]